MITMNSAAEIKKDMLTSDSNVQAVLRALYFYGADYIMTKIGPSEQLIHKEQLVSLLELGREVATIEDIVSVVLNKPMPAKMQIEDIVPETPLLMFVRKGEGPEGDLSRTTFGEYRELKIKEAEIPLPDWWNAPLPLLYIDGTRLLMNGRSAENIPCDAKTLVRQMKSMMEDKTITVKEKKKERTFSLLPICENIFMAEDISGDFEMAEELVWWASVGRAFFTRLEENGAVIRRFSPFQDPPETAAEVIPCMWEGEMIGRLVVELPGDDADEGRKSEPEEPHPPEETAAAPPDVLPEPVPVKPAVVKPKRARKAARERKISSSPLPEEEIKSDEAPMKTGLDKTLENAGNLARLNKNAARKAYGGTAARASASGNGKTSGK
ncbi:MAG: hypothetical protein LBS53_06230 [Synergistaceae bacterium]|jgi:hypothetical protein|nr:hypothetical protein [Synergistaceae bacterium]